MAWTDNGSTFRRDSLETRTGYATLVGFFVMLGLYVYKETTKTEFATPEILIFLFGFFTSEIKSISIGRGENGHDSSSKH